MQRPLQIFSLVLFCLYGNPLLASTATQISNLLEKLQQHAQVSLIVLNGNDAKPLFAHNTEQYMHPASTLKTLTATAAFLKLDRQRPFHTQLQIYGTLQDHQLHGDVVLAGGADPGFSSAALHGLLQQLHQQGVHQVQGEFIILDQHFDQRNHLPGTVWDEQRDCYAAPVSSVSINHNCYTIQLQSSQQQLQIINPSPIEQVSSKIQLSPNCMDQNPASIHHTLYGNGSRVDHDPFHPTTQLSGCLKPNHPNQQLQLSTHNIIKQVQHSIHSSTKKLGITLKQPIQHRTHFNSKHPHWHTIEHHSQALAPILSTMLKQSSNFIAAHLFKQLAHQQYPQQSASWENAERALIEALPWLDLKDASISDGAGLSRTARLSTAILASNLLYQLQHRQFHPLIHMLANNQDHSCRHSQHLQQLQLNSRIYAKSGFIKGVVGLVGYLNPFGTHPKVFALLINGSKNIDHDFAQVEQQLLQLIEQL